MTVARVLAVAALMATIGAALLVGVLFVFHAAAVGPPYEGMVIWDRALQSFLWVIFVPSLITWALLAPFLLDRTRAFAGVVGAVSPFLAIVPAAIVATVASLSGFRVPGGMMFAFGIAAIVYTAAPIAVPVGIVTGLWVHRCVNPRDTP